MKNFDEVKHPGWNDWQHHSTLSVGAAACLLSHVHPFDYEGKGHGDLPAAVKSKGHLIISAIQRGELPAKVLYVVRDGILEPVETGSLLSGDRIAYDTTLACGEFAEWCDKYSYPHPWASSEQLDGHTPEDKPLRERERETLLRLVAALAELAGIDLRADTKGHAEAQSIMEELRARKVKTDKRTVADKLAAARMLIVPKGPGRVTGGSK